MSELGGNKAGSEVAANIVGSTLEKMKEELNQYKGNKQEVYKDILNYEGEIMKK